MRALRQTHTSVDAEGQDIRKRLINWFGHNEEKDGENGVGALTIILAAITLLSCAERLTIERVMSLQCQVARWIVKKRLSRDVLPPTMQEFVALHDPDAVRHLHAFLSTVRCTLAGFKVRQEESAQVTLQSMPE